MGQRKLKARRQNQQTVRYRPILRKEQTAVTRAVREAFPGLKGLPLDSKLIRKPAGHCLAFPYIRQAVALNEQARDARQEWAGTIPSRQRKLWETDARIGKWTDIMNDAIDPEHRASGFSVLVSPIVHEDLAALEFLGGDLTINSISTVIVLGHADMVFMVETIIEDPSLYLEAEKRGGVPSRLPPLVGALISGPPSSREWTRVAMIPCEAGTGIDLGRALAGHLGGTSEMTPTDVFKMVGFASEAPASKNEPDGTPEKSIEGTVVAAVRYAIYMRVSQRDAVGLRERAEQKALDDMAGMSLADAWALEE
jgi:hypothetical protein